MSVTAKLRVSAAYRDDGVSTFQQNLAGMDGNHK